MSNLPVYKCRAQLFEYNDEDFDTSIDAIQNIEEKYAYTYILTLGADMLIKAVPGDTVEQIVGDSADGVFMRGEIAKYSDSDDKLYIIHAGASDGLYHEFVTGRPITIKGDYRSGDSDVSVIAVAEDNKISQNEQNDDFGSISNDFLDFTESNPFGDPS